MRASSSAGEPEGAVGGQDVEPVKTVRRWLRTVCVAVTVLALLVAPSVRAGPGGGGEGKSAAISLPSGWARVEVEGTVATISAHTDTFVFSPQQKDKAGPRPIRLVSGSVIQIQFNLAAGLTDLRVGDQVKVWGLSQPDGTIVAAHVLVLSRRGPSPTLAAVVPLPARGGARGVVLAVSEDTVTLLTEAGQVKEVLRAPTVKVEGSVSGPALQEFDIIRVDGNVLSDGNISATRIVVEFSGSNARRLPGRITAVIPEASLFLLDDAVFVNVVPETFIVQGTTLRFVPDLTIGQRVQIVGPIGATPFVVKARVVAVTL